MSKLCKLHNQSIQQNLKKQGLKVTPSRLELLDIFEHAKEPLTINTLLKKLDSKPDLTTLYRNVEVLQKLGIITEVKFSSKEAYYELAGRHHHHIICESCGKVSDIENCKIDLPNNIFKKAGFKTINHHSLEFFGLCKTCAN